jgi:hypothetical protein
MGRGRSFSLVEEKLLQENFDKTIAELEEMLLQHGYRRSRKSINRKLEKMRDGGDIGFRSKDTIRRSYRQRTRQKKAEPTELDNQDNSWGDSSGSKTASGFNTGVGWDDLE